MLATIKTSHCVSVRRPAAGSGEFMRGLYGIGARALTRLLYSSPSWRAHLDEVLPGSRGVGRRRSARAVNRREAILGPGTCPAGGAPPDWFTPHRRAQSGTPHLEIHEKS